MAQRRLRTEGGGLLLRSPRAHVRRVLEITGLDVMLVGTVARSTSGPDAPVG